MPTFHFHSRAATSSAGVAPAAASRVQQEHVTSRSPHLDSCTIAAQYLSAAWQDGRVPACPVCRQPLLSDSSNAFEIDEAAIDAVLEATDPDASTASVAEAFERCHARDELGPATGWLLLTPTGPLATCARCSTATFLSQFRMHVKRMCALVMLPSLCIRTQRAPGTAAASQAAACDTLCAADCNPHARCRIR